MSICDNFEGALMKAIRSLEQHVDSLMSYDFTGLSDEELEAQLHVVDDRRIWGLQRHCAAAFPMIIFMKLPRSTAGLSISWQFW